MLQRVHMDGVTLPRLYIAENMEDVSIAMDAGIPFIRWTQGNDELIKQLLRPVLEKMFPGIKWSVFLGPKKRFTTKVIQAHHNEPEKPINNLPGSENPEDKEEKFIPLEDKEHIETEVADIADGPRYFRGTDDNVTIEKLSISQYVGDLTSSVNLDVLQNLKLMPQFIGNILDCVQNNLTAHVLWSEGYNKKRHACIGNFDRSNQLRNLIILDISGSIPRGISATMLTLIDTLRTQVNAELIITASKSQYYSINDKLPDPQSLRDWFNYGNESFMFFDIIHKKIEGHQWGHVFSFGDDDTPCYNDLEPLRNTSVKHVHHYHTGKHWRKTSDERTGYAKWCDMLDKNPMSEFNTDWCNIIKE